MKYIRTAICVAWLGVLLTHAQDLPSRYDNLMSLFKAKDSDAIHAFVGSLSKQEFKNILVEYVQKNPPSPQVDTFAAMSMLATLYYAHGAGTNDACAQWVEDVQDQSYPVEWRSVILGHPPFETDDLTHGEVTLFTNALKSIALSAAEPSELRRVALLGLQHAMSLTNYADMLQESISSGDEDPCFRREALLQMSRIVYRGRLKSEQSPEFNKVANDYESLLSDMGSRTNLPPALDESVKLLKRQKKPGKSKGDARSH